MTYRWLLFDADGTLFDFDRAAADALAETFLAHRLDFAPEYLTLYERINQQAWREFELGRLSQSELKVRRFADFLAAIGASADADAFGADYLRHLSTHTDLLDGAAEVVADLARDHRLLLITNGLAEVQRPRFARAPICDRFADIVISGEVGWAKPDPRIFDEAFRRMDHPDRSDVLIIGDSLNSDMRGGRDYGLATCWYNPQKRPRPEGTALTLEISDLRELPALLRA